MKQYILDPFLPQFGTHFVNINLHSCCSQFSVQTRNDTDS